MHVLSMLGLKLFELVHVSLWAYLGQELMHCIDELKPIFWLKALMFLFLDQVHEDIFEKL
jgi:hypothetical protein